MQPHTTGGSHVCMWLAPRTGPCFFNFCCAPVSHSHLLVCPMHRLHSLWQRAQRGLLQHRQRQLVEQQLRHIVINCSITTSSSSSSSFRLCLWHATNMHNHKCSRHRTYCMHCRHAGHCNTVFEQPPCKQGVDNRLTEPLQNPSTLAILQHQSSRHAMALLLATALHPGNSSPTASPPAGGTRQRRRICFNRSYLHHQCSRRGSNTYLDS